MTREAGGRAGMRAQFLLGTPGKLPFIPRPAVDSSVRIEPNRSAAPRDRHTPPFLR